MAPALSSSLKGASLLVLLQVGSRALTFALNQSLLRFLSPEIMGVSAQLELFSISVLFFARESLRVALQRQASSLQSIVNIAYLPLLAGIVLSAAFRWIYATSAALSDVPLIQRALDLQAVATVIELLAEPGFAVAQQKMLYSVRARAETMATIARCLVTFFAFAWVKQQSIEAGAMPFALGQLSYAATLVLVYVLLTGSATKNESFSLLPHRITESKAASEHIFGYLSRPLCTLGLLLYVQSAVKYILTQGDAIIVTAFTTLSEQGAYALASNYGGLIARLLFQPIEESSRNLFAKLCSAAPGTSAPEQSNLKQATSVMHIILRLYNILGLLVVSIGPRTAPLLLSLIAGNRWAGTGAGAVLGTYCYLIPLLALNGVTEAFVAAVADHAQLRRQSMLMTAYFAAFAAAAYFLLHTLQLGAQGLVLANCVNMGCRVVWNMHFTRSFFQRHGHDFSMAAIFPTALSIAAAVGAAAVLSRLNDQDDGLIRMLLNRAAVAVGLLVAIAGGERGFLRECWRLLKPAGSSKKEKS